MHPNESVDSCSLIHEVFAHRVAATLTKRFRPEGLPCFARNHEPFTALRPLQSLTAPGQPRRLHAPWHLS